jgi:hypothetical protein
MGREGFALNVDKAGLLRLDFFKNAVYSNYYKTRSAGVIIINLVTGASGNDMVGLR